MRLAQPMPTILITSERSELLSKMLTHRGFDVLHVPLVTLSGTGIRAPDGAPDDVLVTSAAVARFVPDLADQIRGARVFAVGPATASALQKIGVDIHHVGDSGGVEALKHLEATKGKLKWYIGAKEPSAELEQALRDTRVEHWPVYATTPLVDPDALTSLRADGVCFTSGSAVKSFVQSAGVPRFSVFTIGPTTSMVAQQLGIRVTAMADRPSLTSLADAVQAFFNRPAL